MHSQWSISCRIVIIHLVFIRTISVCVPLCSMDAPTQSIYPHSATLFAAISACVFATIGVFGKFPKLKLPPPWSPPAPPIYRILYATINITGNLITLLALLKSPTIREHATTAFVISLSISDLLFCSFSLPLTAVRFFQEVRMNFNCLATLITVSFPWQSWTFGSTLCKIFPVIFYGNVAVSLLSMVGITLNR